jgi:hypothetical protein
MRPRFTYRPLNTPKAEIRLISVLPSDGDDVDLECNLIHASLADDLVYTALSYSWVDRTIFTNAEIDTPEILVVHGEAIGLWDKVLPSFSTLQTSCSILGDRKESGVISPIIQEVQQ